MEYDINRIGKIRKIDLEQGLGEIVSSDNSFFFILDNDNNLKEGDIVSFRGEQVQNVNKAFFVNRLTKLKNNAVKLKSKTYRPEGNE